MSEEDLAGLDEDDLLAEDREVEEREECVQDTLELISTESTLTLMLQRCSPRW